MYQTGSYTLITQYRTYTFRHPEDMEVVPHPKNVPPQKGSPRWKIKTSTKIKIQDKKPKQKRFDQCCYQDFRNWTETKWFYGRYAHSGIRVRPKTKTNDKFEKNASLKKCRPDSKADFPKQMCWYFEVNIECVAYDIEYLTYNIK